MSAWDLSCQRLLAPLDCLTGQQLALLAAAAARAAAASANSDHHPASQLDLGRAGTRTSSATLAAAVAAAATKTVLVDHPAGHKSTNRSLDLTNRWLHHNQHQPSAFALAADSLSSSPSSSRCQSIASIDNALASQRGSPLTGPIHSSRSSLLARTPSSQGSASLITSSTSGSSSPERNSTRGGLPSGPLVADRRARKKDQNRRAAYNYRRKKMEERNKMIEEEARLVHRHVRLTGKVARLEERILFILSTNTRKILDREGYALCYLCPICLKSCDNIVSLRNHLKIQHNPMQQQQQQQQQQLSRATFMDSNQEQQNLTNNNYDGDI